MAHSAKSAPTYSKNEHLIRWVQKTAELTKPANIHWVDGSQKEFDTIAGQMVKQGSLIKLNQELWPGCFYARSDPSDVARMEDRTFVCSLARDNAGPTNNWENPQVMRRKLKSLFAGCMRGRTMYVLPFSMGPVESPVSQIGVQITDSPYVVINMRIMARIGLAISQEIDKGERAGGPMSAFRGRTIGTGRERCAMALQQRKICCAFSGNPRNLVVRLGLWRQRFIGEKMLGVEDCLDHRSR